MFASDAITLNDRSTIFLVVDRPREWRCCLSICVSPAAVNPHDELQRAVHANFGQRGGHDYLEID